MGLSTPCVDYYICFPRVVVDSKIIILDKLLPSSFSKASIWLSEDTHQTLMVRIKFTSLFHKVIPSNLESMNHSD
jgi:hypothetical protein